MQKPKVIDADGHIYENHEEIEEYFEGKYRGMRRARAYPLFPSLDGWPRGLGAGRPDKVTETKPEDVIKFVDHFGVGLHRAVSDRRSRHRFGARAGLGLLDLARL